MLQMQWCQDFGPDTIAGCAPDIIRPPPRESFQSSFPFLNQNLGVNRCRTERANIAARGFIEVRFTHLPAIRTSDHKRFFVFWFRHTCHSVVCGRSLRSQLIIFASRYRTSLLGLPCTEERCLLHSLMLAGGRRTSPARRRIR